MNYTFLKLSIAGILITGCHTPSMHCPETHVPGAKESYTAFDKSSGVAKSVKILDTESKQSAPRVTVRNIHDESGAVAQYLCYRGPSENECCRTENDKEVCVIFEEKSVDSREPSRANTVLPTRLGPFGRNR